MFNPDFCSTPLEVAQGILNVVERHMRGVTA